MLHEQGKSIGQSKGHEDVLKRNTMSINIIKIVLGTEFDLMIAQTQIKDLGEDSISIKEILPNFNTNKTRHPFKKDQV
jgi:hypothetical protein